MGMTLLLGGSGRPHRREELCFIRMFRSQGTVDERSRTWAIRLRHLRRDGSLLTTRPLLGNYADVVWHMHVQTHEPYDTVNSDESNSKEFFDPFLLLSADGGPSLVREGGRALD